MTQEERLNLISTLENFPSILECEIENLNSEQLNTPYGEGKWTIRQVVHHLADSHMHAYLRTKWLYTENNPTLKTYEQNDWAILSDAKEEKVEFSILILKGLHTRWTSWLKKLNELDFQKTAFHPENGEMKLEKFLVLYANHCKNHLKQITDLKEKMKW